jgi:hypothetical protein
MRRGEIPMPQFSVASEPERLALRALLETVKVWETEHWITLEFGDSGEGFGIWKRTGVIYRMREHAVDADPMPVERIE